MQQSADDRDNRNYSKSSVKLPKYLTECRSQLPTLDKTKRKTVSKSLQLMGTITEMMPNCVLRRTRYKKTQKRRFRVLEQRCTELLLICARRLSNKVTTIFFYFLQAVIMKKRPLVCQFASPLDVDIHNTPQVSTLETYFDPFFLRNYAILRGSP